MYPPGERSVAPSPALVPSAAPSGSAAAGDVEVLSPTVGMFWRSPQPGAPPFVEVGQTVERGDILCIVEVMKLMNNVISEVAGRVTAILVGNGGAVEHGQVLMTITPANG
jgi:acetyl-CoA carboxylase biotin carboxyl carrier protein